MTLFTRDDLVGALRDLIEELHGAGDTVGLRLVGGGALALRYFDRRTTNDLDALHVRPGSDEAVVKAARLVAERRGWDPTWINFEVTGSGGEPLYGRGIKWESLYDSDGVVIQVASAEALLVMKLRATRPGRDTDDIRHPWLSKAATDTVPTDSLWNRATACSARASATSTSTALSAKARPASVRAVRLPCLRPTGQTTSVAGR